MSQIINQVLSCKNICLRIKKFSAPRYKQGLKFCRLCEAAFDTMRKTCECCGTWLRTKRHAWNNKGKKSRLERKIAYEKRKPYLRHYYARNAERLKAKYRQRWHLKNQTWYVNTIT